MLLGNIYILGKWGLGWRGWEEKEKGNKVRQRKKFSLGFVSVTGIELNKKDGKPFRIFFVYCFVSFEKMN